jgi:gas vesicle protein
MQRIIRFFTGVFVGWMVGSVVALLFAPSAGEELREEIRGRSTGFIDDIKGAAEQRRIEMEAQLAAMRTPHPSAEKIEQ